MQSRRFGRPKGGPLTKHPPSNGTALALAEVIHQTFTFVYNGEDDIVEESKNTDLGMKSRVYCAAWMSGQSNTLSIVSLILIFFKLTFKI